MAITHPRPCSICGKKLKNRRAFSRHRKYCGEKTDPVQCPYCETKFQRKDDMSKHVRKFHSERAKRKAEESAELLRMELLHSEKVPRLSTEGRTGGALTTRGIEREPDQRDNTSDVKVTKQEDAYQRLDPTVEYGGGKDPLYVADFKKLGPAKRWNKDTLVNQKFILTIDQKRGQKENEDLNIGATHAIAVAIDNLVEELKIPGDYWMTFQIGSREHRKEGLTGET